MDERVTRRALKRALDPGAGFPSATLLERTMGRLGERPAAAERRSGQRLAAAVAAVLLLASVGVLLLARLHSAPGVESPAAVGTSPTRIGSPQLQVLPGGGAWLVERSLDGSALIFRTSDLGAHWTAAGRLPAVAKGAPRLVVNFFDERSGVIVGPPFRVASTVDGGAHWQVADGSQTAGGLVAADFVSAREGWALTVSKDVSVDVLWHTTDGGRHWERVSQPPLFLGVLDAGVVTIGFTSSSDGWLASGNVLQATHDGGRTWQQVNLEESRSITGACCLALAPGVPQMFGADGLLDAAEVWGGPPRVATPAPTASGIWQATISSNMHELYASHDGGKTWSFVRSVAGQAWFSDALQGYAVNGPDVSRTTPFTNTASLTADGGVTWTAPRTVPVDAGWQVSALAFTGQVGVATVVQALPFPSPAPRVRATPSMPRYSVLRTTDGGLHWTRVALPAQR
jgi:photosystem II stability/assembly factor-like uncharacterized protein